MAYFLLNAWMRACYTNAFTHRALKVLKELFRVEIYTDLKETVSKIQLKEVSLAIFMPSVPISCLTTFTAK